MTSTPPWFSFVYFPRKALTVTQIMHSTPSET